MFSSVTDHVFNSDILAAYTHAGFILQCATAQLLIAALRATAETAYRGWAAKQQNKEKIRLSKTSASVSASAAAAAAAPGATDGDAAAPGTPSNNALITAIDFLVAIVIACFMGFLLPGTFQWAFAWNFALLVRQLTGSALVATVLARVVPGAPSYATLGRCMDRVIKDGMTSVPESVAKSKQTLLLVWDNAGYYTEGSTRNTGFGLLSNPVVTLRTLYTIALTESNVMIQAIFENSPWNWPSLAFCPTTILEPDANDKGIMMAELHARILLGMLELKKKNWQPGDSSKQRNPAPKVKACEKEVGEDSLKRVCTNKACEFPHPIDCRLQYCDKELGDDGHICGAKIPTRKETESGLYQENKFRDRKPTESKRDVHTAMPMAHRSAPTYADNAKPSFFDQRAAAQAAQGAGANPLGPPYKRVIQPVVLPPVPTDPGSHATQQFLRDTYTAMAYVLGAPGYAGEQAASVLRYFVFIVADLGALTHPWWKWGPRNIVVMMPVFHFVRALMRVILELLGAADNKYSVLGALYGYYTMPSQSCLFDVGQTHKSHDFIKVTTDAMFLSLLMATLDRMGVQEIDAVETEVEQVVACMCEDPGDGEAAARVRSLTALVLDVMLPFELLVKSFKAGPTLFLCSMAAIVHLLPTLFAMGMTKYAPFTAFFVVLMRYLYRGTEVVVGNGHGRAVVTKRHASTAEDGSYTVDVKLENGGGSLNGVSSHAFTLPHHADDLREIPPNLVRAANYDMLDVLENFQSVQLKEQNDRGAPHHGWDELQEEDVSRVCKSGGSRANTFKHWEQSQFLAGMWDTMQSFLAVCGIKRPQSRQQVAVDFSSVKLDMVRFLNHHEVFAFPSRASSSASAASSLPGGFTSFDGTEKLLVGNSVHTMLAIARDERMPRWVQVAMRDDIDGEESKFKMSRSLHLARPST